MRSVLLDTGGLVALLDGADSHHRACVDAFATISSPLLTTEAVLTEALHLLGDIRSQELALAFVLRGAATLVPTDAEALTHIKTLMIKYADVPMDYADATLVRLASEVGSNVVFTLDRRGFAAYRIDGRKAFVILP